MYVCSVWSSSTARAYRDRRFGYRALLWVGRTVGMSQFAYLPTIPDCPELLRKSASNYGITAEGKIITEI